MFRRTLLRSLCTVVAATVLSAQQFPSLAGRRLDLDFISRDLPSRHPNFFAHLDRATFDNAVANLDARLTTASDAEFYTGLAKLVAMAGDGHTLLTLTAAPFQFIPLRFRWFDDGVFVTHASSAYSEALGSQLIRIGDTPIAAALPAIATVIPHENDAWLRDQTPAYLVNRTLLEGLGLVPSNGPSPLTFRTLAGREFTLEVGPSSGPLIAAVSGGPGSIPLYQQNGSANYWYIYSAPDRMLYFRYNSCVDIPGNPFAIFAADLLAALDKNPIDTFVFDLRSNTGGSTTVVAPLLNGLAERFSRLSSNPQFWIYDVFDGGTFSSGERLAEDLLIPTPQSIPNPTRGVNLSTRVVSIGQPTGAKPAAFGQVTGFRLPGSAIAGRNSTRFFNAPAGIPDLPSLLPSIPIAVRSTDYFARFDPVMAMILARGAGAPALPTGDVITVNAASFRTDQGIAPGSFAAAFGNFPAVPDEILVSGVSARPLAAASSQVNFIVPDATPPGTATIGVRAAGKELGSGTVTISRSGPGIFVTQPADPSQPGAVLNQDGTLNGKVNPADSGSIVQIFATGYGGQPVQVYFAEQPAEVVFSGSHSQFPGLWQVNARIPPGLTGQGAVFFLSDARPSNGATLWVR